MAEELIKQLLEAGVHFGHQTKRWNPKMAPYIFGKRSSIYIIDLEKTADFLQKARDFLKDLARKGEVVLFVGTKKQAQETVKEQALACGMYFVDHRWPGGLMTNFATIKKSITRLKDIEKMKEDGRMQGFSKKEISLMMKEHDKLERNFGGIKNMERLPGALFIIDSKKESTAIAEARKLKMPIVALIDTNCDPDMITYPIPGNDDAIKSIKMITSLVAESVAEGRKGFLDYLAQANVKPIKPQVEETREIVVTEQEVEKVGEKIIELVEKDAGTDDKASKKLLKAKVVDTAADLKAKRRPKK